MSERRTQVGIVGAGPAGLMLGQLLARQGIDTVIVEARSQSHVIERVPRRRARAGHGRPHASGRAGRPAGTPRALPRGYLPGLQRAASPHRHDRRVQRAGDHRLWTERSRPRPDRRTALPPACRCTLKRRPRASPRSAPLTRPSSMWMPANESSCGATSLPAATAFMGSARAAIPAAVLRDLRTQRIHSRWLGHPRDAAPTSDELVYSLHERGFALFSMRSPNRDAPVPAMRARRPDIAEWPDDRIWRELQRRLATDDGWLPCRRTRSCRRA